MKFYAYGGNIIKNHCIHGIIINKLDLIKLLYAGDKNFTILITDYKDRSEKLRINFENEESLDYFIEKIRRDYDLRKPTTRKRLESTRLKAMEIKRELNKIRVAQN